MGCNEIDEAFCNGYIDMASIFDLIPKGTLILLVVLLVFPTTLKYYSPRIKGWFGELMVRRALAKLQDSYRQWHDVYLLDSEGHTTQIDHLVASVHGIFVIETKNYKGWIYGSENQKNWTQTIYRKKSKFQNPLHQNARHIRVLAEATGLKKADFYNVIFFVGDATLKSEFPENVMTNGLLNYIKAAEPDVISQSQIDAFFSQVDTLNLSGEKGIAKRHLKSLKQHKLAS